MFTGKVQGVLSDLGPDLPQNDLSQPVTTNVQDKTSKLPRYSAFLGSILFTVERIVESSGDATYKIFKNGSLVFTIDKAEKAELTDDTPILPTTKLKEILQEKFSEEETQHLTTIIKIQQRAVINKGIQQVFGIMETDAGYVLRKVSPGIEKEPNAYIWLNLADLQKAIASNEFDREVARKHYEKTRQTLVDLIGLKPSIDNIRTKDADRIKEPNTLERAFYLAKVSLAETYLALSQPEEAFRILPEINQQFINHISQDLISDKYNFQFHKAAGLIARAYLAEGATLKEINLKPGKINDLKKQYPHDYPEKIPEATAVLGEAIKVIEKFYNEVTSDF